MSNRPKRLKRPPKDKQDEYWLHPTKGYRRKIKSEREENERRKG